MIKTILRHNSLLKRFTFTTNKTKHWTYYCTKFYFIDSNQLQNDETLFVSLKEKGDKLYNTNDTKNASLIIETYNKALDINNIDNDKYAFDKFDILNRMTSVYKGINDINNTINTEQRNL